VALHAVALQAYVEGVSTRRVDDLVIAMGGTGISTSEVRSEHGTSIRNPTHTDGTVRGAPEQVRQPGRASAGAATIVGCFLPVCAHWSPSQR